MHTTLIPQGCHGIPPVCSVLAYAYVVLPLVSESGCLVSNLRLWYGLEYLGWHIFDGTCPESGTRGDTRLTLLSAQGVRWLYPTETVTSNLLRLITVRSNMYSQDGKRVVSSEF